MANNAAAFQPGQQPGAEPSMEEILASIRRIIADDSLGTKKDETPAAAPPPPPAPAPAMVEPEDDSDADVLDLAEVGHLAGPESDDVMIGEAEDVMVDTGGFPGMPEPEPVMVLPEDFPEPVPVMVTPPPMPAPVMVAPTPAPTPLATPVAMQEHILSRETSGLVASAFATLARNTPMPAPGRSLEDVVAEMLRPMLRDWMDSHLPNIVERLVKAEIERVARGG
jgi:cell pole-organizing protein PopZ